ncbi:hypothetical protein FKM82_026544 [Ascaphus truei]
MTPSTWYLHRTKRLLRCQPMSALPLRILLSRITKPASLCPNLHPPAPVPEVPVMQCCASYRPPPLFFFALKGLMLTMLKASYFYSLLLL